MSYEAWRISFQDSEQAARSAYRQVEELLAENARLRGLAGLEDDDPSPYCQYCGAMEQEYCTCGPRAEND